MTAEQVARYLAGLEARGRELIDNQEAAQSVLEAAGIVDAKGSLTGAYIINSGLGQEVGLGQEASAMTNMTKPAIQHKIRAGAIRDPHEIKAEAIRDLIGTAQHLNRQAAALRRLGYEVELIVPQDMSAVAVSLCPAGADRA